MQWRRSLQSTLNRKNGCLHTSIVTPDPQCSPSGCSDEGRCTPDWTGKNVCHHASRETPDPESSPFGCSDEGRCTMDWKGKKGLYPRFEREGWSLEFTFRMQWRRSLHSGLNGENGCHHSSRETLDPESSPSGDAWSREFTFWMHWRRSLHSGLNGKKWLLLRFERDAWSLKFTFWMQWRRSLPAGLNGENGCHHASKETTDPESSPSGCSDEGRCTPDWTGKNGCYFASRETPDLESSPSGCSAEGHCTPDWTGKTAVTTLRERRLIPRVHLLDAVTKVAGIQTEPEKRLSQYFDRDAWSPVFTFWM